MCKNWDKTPLSRFHLSGESPVTKGMGGWGATKAATLRAMSGGQGTKIPVIAAVLPWGISRLPRAQSCPVTPLSEGLEVHSQKARVLIYSTNEPSFLPYFNYFWSKVCYCSLFVINLLFALHFLVCLHYLSFFFGIALFVYILFLQYFFLCCYFSSLVSVKFYLCISYILFLFHYF